MDLREIIEKVKMKDEEKTEEQIPEVDFLVSPSILLKANKQKRFKQKIR